MKYSVTWSVTLSEALVLSVACSVMLKEPVMASPLTWVVPVSLLVLVVLSVSVWSVRWSCSVVVSLVESVSV